MTTVSTSFTGVAQSVGLYVPVKGETVSIAISGTYAATIEFQKASSFSGLSWETLKTFNTANATEAFDVTTTADRELYRLSCTSFTSGTAVTTVSDGDFILDQNPTNTFTRTQAGMTERGTLTVVGATTLTGATSLTGSFTQVEGHVRSANTIVSITTATLAITEALHAGRTMTLNRAAGIIITLPAATGTGNVYRFIVEDTTTGTSHITGLSGDILTGFAILGDTGTPADIFFPDGTDLILDLYGTSNSTGGLKGARATFTDIAADLWHVEYFSAGTTEVTPFK